MKGDNTKKKRKKRISTQKQQLHTSISIKQHKRSITELFPSLTLRLTPTQIDLSSSPQTPQVFANKTSIREKIWW